MLISRYAGPLSIALMGLAAGAAVAQDFPSKPIRIVISTAGSGNDFVARQIGPGVSNALGQPVVVDNRANGAIAAEFVAKAPPDGYTLTIQAAILWVLPLYRK